MHSDFIRYLIELFNQNLKAKSRTIIQCNWEKLYWDHQRWEEYYSCVTFDAIFFWALISSHRSQEKEHLEIVTSQSTLLSLSTTVTSHCLVTRSIFVFLRKQQEICKYLLIITPGAVAIRIPIQDHCRTMKSLPLTSVVFILFCNCSYIMRWVFELECNKGKKNGGIASILPWRNGQIFLQAIRDQTQCKHLSFR